MGGGGRIERSTYKTTCKDRPYTLPPEVNKKKGREGDTHTQKKSHYKRNEKIYYFYVWREATDNCIVSLVVFL